MTVRLECYQGCKLENGIIFVSVLSGTRWHLLLHGVDAILISQDEDEYSVVGGEGVEVEVVEFCQTDECRISKHITRNFPNDHGS